MALVWWTDAVVLSIVYWFLSGIQNPSCPCMHQLSRILGNILGAKFIRRQLQMIFELKHFVILLFIIIKINNRRKTNIKRCVCLYENLISLLFWRLGGLLNFWYNLVRRLLHQCLNCIIWVDSIFCLHLVLDTRGPLTKPGVGGDRAGGW